MDLIRDSMSISPLTLYSAGGVIEFETPEMLGLSDGDLEGDNSEGTVAEKVLDYSLCPENYLPLTSTDPPCTTPQAIALATTELSSRNSVFHRLMVRSRKSNIVDIEEVAGVSLRKASNGSRARTGVFINNSSGYSSGATGAMTVDGADATAHFSVGSEVFKADGKNLGLVTSVTTTSVTIGGGTTSAVVDDDELFSQPQHFGVGTTNQSTCVNEYFDIVEHSTRGNKTVLIIQPSDRERFNLLSKMVSDTESANFVSIESLVSKGRVISFSDMEDGSMMLAHGISSDLSSSGVYVKGSLHLTVTLSKRLCRVRP